MKSFIKLFLLLVLGLGLGFLFGRRTAKIGSESTIIRDTVSYTIVDTLTVEKPVPVYSYIHDTVRTYFTTIEHDTVLVDVPIERKVYAEDSLYYCEISGYRPQLEYLMIYPTTTTITIHDTKTEYRNSRISFGVQAGYGISKSGLSPYLGAGISYNIFSINNLKIK